MAKIPVILEAGRADGKLATSDSIFDENKGVFQSEINDIQDTLNSDNSNKPLSAKQGKVLKELLDAKVIESGSVPIDTEPIEGNTTHVVNSDGLAKEFNKCNTAIINTDRIENGAVTSEKIAASAFDSTLSVSGKIAPADIVGNKLNELESKVDELENGEKQVLTFLRGSTTIPCDFKQGHIYKCTFARYIPYASESPKHMKVTLIGDGVTNSYIPKENGVYLSYGDTYYYVSPNNYTSAVSYSDGTSEWDVYDITEQSEDVFRMMREAEFAPNGDAQYDSLGNIIQQSVLWSNGCSGVLVRSLFNEDSFEFNKEEVTCINALGGVLSYKVTFENEFDDYGNIYSKNIKISKI